MLICLLFAIVCVGQEGTTVSKVLRNVRGQTVISKEFPRAELTVDRGFRFVGSQQINLYGNAEAEQYIFVKVSPRGIVDRFYWLQFEHFLPTNTLTYDYEPKRTVEMGGLQFIYDVKSWPGYSAMQTEDPASDGAAVERLLKNNHFSFPDRVVRVRMFHLPSSDHRTELMIIYGEALPERSEIPLRPGGVELDTASPASARMFLAHARQGLVVRKR